MIEDSLNVRAEKARFLVLTRHFPAEPSLVFRCFTDPAWVPRWLGKEDFPLTKCEIDLRIGGGLRYEWTRASDGWVMGLSGKYLELDPPYQMVHTELFDEDWTGGEARVTTSFEHDAPGTRVGMRIQYATKEARDAVLEGSFAEGLEAHFQLLDTFLEGRAGSTPGASRKPRILAPGEGRRYPMGPVEAVFLADRDETQGALSVSEWWLEPDTAGPGAHRHPEDNAFYVIEGVMSIRVGERWIEAPRGSFVLVPGGMLHDFENRSAKRAGLLALVTPGGFEGEMGAIQDYWAKNPPGPARGG